MRDLVEARRLQQIERHLNRLGSQVEGDQKFQADRIVDVLELIQELRDELTQVKESLNKSRQAYAELKQSINESQGAL